MGKFFNTFLKNANFPFKKVSLGSSYAEERRGNLEIRRQSEPSGDLPPVGRDEGEAEQDNPDPGRDDQAGSVGEGLPGPSSSSKAWVKRQGNRAARRRN